MKIKEIWFDANHIWGRDEAGKEYKQSLLWYPKLHLQNSEANILSALMAFIGGIWTRTSASRVLSTRTLSQVPCSDSF